MHPLKTYRIETERLIIRCYKTEDAPLLKQSVDENLEHLSPWMPWIRFEPETVEAKAERIQNFITKYESGEDFTMGIFNKDETQLLGSTGLHNRLQGNALEIGYWLHKDFINKGLITENVKALTRIAFEVECVDRLEIHCDEKNIASAKVPAKCGYTLREVLIANAKDNDGNDRNTMIWEMSRSAYLRNLREPLLIRAFDASGKDIQRFL
ncbi:MAG: GNAT family N-acetyltransferase [Chitinophagales bacterium]